MTITAQEILGCLEEMADATQARHLMRFFKTGPGEYGEGDRFLGLRVPQTRSIVREAALQVPFEEIIRLLHSEWHEARLAGFLLLVAEMKKALPGKRDSTAKAIRRDETVTFYLSHARQANNWDLVDLSSPKILGEWLLHPSADGKMPDHSILDRLVASHNLWEQRIGIVATWRLIHDGQTDDAVRLSEKLLRHPHDLIHKATGWMLREAGKKEPDVLTDFLERHYASMHRTTLRYAIEKLPEQERQFWLHRK